MKRITIDQVRTAYAATNLKPTRSAWRTTDRCACALGAMLVHAGFQEPGMLDYPMIAKIFHLDPNYVKGFLAGFDLDKERTDYSCFLSLEVKYTLFWRGFDDGMAIAKEVLT